MDEVCFTKNLLVNVLLKLALVKSIRLIEVYKGYP